MDRPRSEQIQRNIVGNVKPVMPIASRARSSGKMRRCVAWGRRSNSSALAT